MNGYWFGTYSGSNSGEIVVEVDDMGSYFEGCAYVYDAKLGWPSTFAALRTASKAAQFQIKAPLAPLHPDTAEPTDWQQVANRFPGFNFPMEANVAGRWSATGLSLQWFTNIGTSGSAQLPKSNVGLPSACQPLQITTWADFKDHVAQLQHYRFIYRGQTRPSRLCTPFHRTGRGDLRKFLSRDIAVLHAHLSARTKHYYDLRNPVENAAFFHLVQHHGYPTPLLDWTHSPYVAAYFAYYRVKSADAAQATEDEKVRVFVFDKMQWCSDFPQIMNTSTRRPHFSVVEPVAIENERMVPQQALSTFTTVDDVETLIQRQEQITNKRYLEVIDLPLGERDHVIRELRLMGITQGSLFPGLDGACQELKERFFDT
jgi:hypothetical protein